MQSARAESAIADPALAPQRPLTRPRASSPSTEQTPSSRSLLLLNEGGYVSFELQSRFMIGIYHVTPCITAGVYVATELRLYVRNDECAMLTTIQRVIASGSDVNFERRINRHGAPQPGLRQDRRSISGADHDRVLLRRRRAIEVQPIDCMRR